MCTIGSICNRSTGLIAMTSWRRMRNVSECLYSLYAWFYLFVTNIVFMTGDINRPIIYQVENVRDGASFSTRLVHAVQKGENIFVALISYHRHEPSLAVHQFTMPHVQPPEELLSYDELIRDALVYVYCSRRSGCKVL